MPSDEGAHGLANFVIPFANALSKLRDGKNACIPVTLSADEVVAVVEAFQLLKKGERTQ